MSRTIPIIALLLFVLNLTGIPVSAQDETLINLSSYPIPRTKHSTPKKAARKAGALPLPFFDDFSRSLPFPSSELWEPNAVTANQGYAINPPTIGVATFDAINRNGELYPTLTTTAQPSDTLTSKPVDLSLQPSDSVYLSFCFQAKGRGYEPDKRDSLVVDFYASSTDQWIRVWSASAEFPENRIIERYHLQGKTDTIKAPNLDSIFRYVTLKIIDPKFLTENFRFRITGYASLSANTQIPGLRSNSDHWHIDMVHLDSHRNWNDTTYNDICFDKPIDNPMLNYTAIPWKHFNSALSKEFPDPMKFTIHYRNLGPFVWNISRQFEIIDHSAASEPYHFLGGAENIYQYDRKDYTRFYLYNFKSAWADSAKFTLKTFLITDNDPLRHYLRYNDTLTRTLTFKNYYALDDGTAESGYGLFGQGAEYGMVAERFDTYQTDTIKGIMVYFNRTAGDANQVKFKLTIWNSDNGKPGDIIYQKFNVLPLFTNELNRFTIYRIDPVEIPEGEFFIGWQQTSQDMLNVGFDMNTDNSSRIYYNLNGTWTNTRFKGTLMLRPIMGSLYQFPTSIPTETTKGKLCIYPNPASERITLTLPNGVAARTIQLIGINGSIHNLSTGPSTTTYSLSDISPGFYLVRATDLAGKTFTGKLIVTK